MGCACGGKKQNVDYEVTFKDGSPTVVVDSMAKVRIALAQSSRGGSFKIIQKP